MDPRPKRKMNPAPSSAFVVLAVLMCLVAVLVNFGMYRETACTDTVYVGTLDGEVAISKDGGDTWSPVLTNGVWIFSVKADGDHVYVGTVHGIAVSHDGGASWSVKNIQTHSSCDSAVDSVFVNEDKHVYALGGREYGCSRVAVSSDNGETWPINFALPDRLSSDTAQNIYVDGSRIYVTMSSGYYPPINRGGFGYTDDFGATWTYGLESDDVLCVVGNGQTIYAGLFADGAPVSMSMDDGLTWKTVNTMVKTMTTAVKVAWSMYLQDDTLYVPIYGGGLSWSNDFITWTRKTTVDGLASNVTHAIVGSGSNLYLGTNNGLSISRDKGQTWITKKTEDGLPIIKDPLSPPPSTIN